MRPPPAHLWPRGLPVSPPTRPPQLSLAPRLALAAVTGPPWPPALHWPSLPLSLHWPRRCAALPSPELTNRLAGQQTLGPVSRAQQRAAPYSYCACAAAGACAVRAVRGSHCRRNLLLGGVSQRVEGPYIQWGRTETAHWTERAGAVHTLETKIKDIRGFSYTRQRESMEVLYTMN